VNLKNNRMNKPFLFSMVLCLLACKPDLERYSGVPVVDIERNIKNFKFVNLSDIANEIDYIPLETLKDQLIQYIGDIIILNDRIIIRDIRSCKAYNLNGKYICCYGSFGKGPGQYTGINSISYDEINNNLLISNHERLLEFSVDGVLLKEMKVIYPDSTHWVWQAKTIGNSIFYVLVHPATSNTRIVFFNEKHEIVGRYANYYNEPQLYTNMIMYQTVNRPELSKGLNRKLLFNDGLCDTVYYIDEHFKRAPAYYFSFGKYRDLFKLLKETKNKSIDSGIEYQMYINKLIETNTILFFDCAFRKYAPETEKRKFNQAKLPEGFIRLTDNPNISRGIFNRITSELVFLKKDNAYQKESESFSGFINDIDGGVPFWPTAQPYGNKLVCSINAYELKEYIASDAFKDSKPKYPEKKKALEDLANSLGWEDNPVLMVVTLK
jgi:hypothetical protein